MLQLLNEGRLRDVVNKLNRYEAQHGNLILSDGLFPSLYSVLAVALHGLRDLNATETVLQNGILHYPNETRLWINLGETYLALMKLSDAEVAFEKALSLEDKFALTRLLAAKTWRSSWKNIEELGAMIRSEIQNCMLNQMCFIDSSIGLELAEIPLEIVKVISSQASFSRDNDHKIPAEELRQSPVSSVATSSPSSSLEKHRLRVGFLSSDFNIHPVSSLIRGLIQFLPRKEMDVIVIALNGDFSWWAYNISQEADEFHLIHNMNTFDGAALLASLQLDILVELNGLTKFSGLSLLAHRPAPLQITFLGLPATTGSQNIDYLIGDPWVTPPENRPHFMESLALLNLCYITNDYAQTLGHTITAMEEKMDHLIHESQKQKQQQQPPLTSNDSNKLDAIPVESHPPFFMYSSSYSLINPSVLAFRFPPSSRGSMSIENTSSTTFNQRKTLIQDHEYGNAFPSSLSSACLFKLKFVSSIHLVNPLTLTTSSITTTSTTAASSSSTSTSTSLDPNWIWASLRYLIGTLSNSQKIDPMIFQVWMNVMSQRSQSVMLFHNHSGRSDSLNSLRKLAQASGLRSYQLQSMKMEEWKYHLQAKQPFQVLVDTFFKQGHTTGLDGLWAGIPTISLGVGHGMAGRAALSMSDSGDFPWGLATSLKEYEDLMLSALPLASAWPDCGSEFLGSATTSSPSKSSPMTLNLNLNLNLPYVSANRVQASCEKLWRVSEKNKISSEDSSVDKSMDDDVAEEVEYMNEDVNVEDDEINELLCEKALEQFHVYHEKGPWRRHIVDPFHGLRTELWRKAMQQQRKKSSLFDTRLYSHQFTRLLQALFDLQSLRNLTGVSSSFTHKMTTRKFHVFQVSLASTRVQSSFRPETYVPKAMFTKSSLKDSRFPLLAIEYPNTSTIQVKVDNKEDYEWIDEDLYPRYDFHHYLKGKYSGMKDFLRKQSSNSNLPQSQGSLQEETLQPNELVELSNYPSRNDMKVPERSQGVYFPLVPKIRKLTYLSRLHYNEIPETFFKTLQEPLLLNIGKSM